MKTASLKTVPNREGGRKSPYNMKHSLQETDHFTYKK